MQQPIVLVDPWPVNRDDTGCVEQGRHHSPLPLSARHLRLAVKFIEFYALHGARPPVKWLCDQVYGRHREIIFRDINALIVAGILKMDRRFGHKTLRPAPEYRLPFADEVTLAEGVRGKLVGKLKQQLKQKEDCHNA